MRRALLRFAIAPRHPPLVRHLPEGVVLAPFGRWLRERVASAIPDWPAVGFHRIEITDAGLELLLVAGNHARAEAQFAAVLRAMWRETSRGAVRCGWTKGEIWASAEIVVREGERQKGRRGERGPAAPLVPSEARNPIAPARDPSLRSG